MAQAEPRHLITTADERSWKFDRPAIFLGEWCRLYDRRDEWSAMDAIVAAPYGLDPATKDRDHALARATEDELMGVLRDELNAFHGTDHSLRFWQIVLGHWLRRYVDVVFNRYHVLQQCLANYPVSGTTVLRSEGYSLATLDSSAFIWATNDDLWNNALYARVLELAGADVAIEDVSADPDAGFRLPAVRLPGGVGARAKGYVYRALDSLAHLGARDGDALIISSYLPKVESAKLQFRLRQLPRRWRTPSLVPCQPDSELRQKLAARLPWQGREAAPGCAGSLLFDLLPTCYLEGYADMAGQVGRLGWPSRPRFILTGGNFDTDELFKLWTAEQAEHGAPYHAAQHGSNYGTHRYINRTVEEVTTDKFLTWGWNDGLPQQIPAFVLRKAGRKPTKIEREGGLLLIELHPNHQIACWDEYHEFTAYFDDQQSFVRALSPACRDALTVRLHGIQRRFRWSEPARWRDFDPSLSVDPGDRPIDDLIRSNRLVVHSYDSTGILEMLADNIPMLAFWQDGLDHLRDSAKPYYQFLIDAGIVHFSSVSAAAKVNEVWDDVDGWWQGDALQSARRTFCDRYARSSRKPAEELYRLLVDR